MNLKNLSNEMDDDNFLSEEESQDMDAQLDDTDSEMKSDNDAGQYLFPLLNTMFIDIFNLFIATTDSEFEENNKYSEAESDFDQSDEDLINSESDYDDNELKNNSNNLESGKIENYLFGDGGLQADTYSHRVIPDFNNFNILHTSISYDLNPQNM